MIQTQQRLSCLIIDANVELGYADKPIKRFSIGATHMNGTVVFDEMRGEKGDYSPQ